LIVFGLGQLQLETLTSWEFKLPEVDIAHRLVFSKVTKKVRSRIEIVTVDINDDSELLNSKQPISLRNE